MNLLFFFNPLRLLKFKEECAQVSEKKQDKINSFYQFITFAIHNRTLLNLIRPQNYEFERLETYVTVPRNFRNNTHTHTPNAINQQGRVSFG